MIAWVINSDERHRPGGWRIMLDKRKVFAGGPIMYGEMLEKLKASDTVFLRLNGRGVVGYGKVVREWSGRRNSPRLVNWCDSFSEYSVDVNWISSTLDETLAVSLAELRELGYGAFRHTLISVESSVADGIASRLADRTQGAIVKPGRHEVAEKGAGFGDYVQNRKVEKAAISYVTRTYRTEGWRVESVEAENCGYDLRCTRKRARRHVEVKGISGDTPFFIITRNEANTAECDPLFRICVVTKALSKNRSCQELTARQFLANYELTPLSFSATPRKRRGRSKG